MGMPFLGSEAVLGGEVSKSALRSRYTRLFRDVYVAPDVELTPLDRAKAGWLWSRRRGIVAGLTASAVHGSRWVEADQPVELVHENRHCLPGLRIRGDNVSPDEIHHIEGIPITSPERTALDLACWYPHDEAVAAVDALVRATQIKVSDVELLADRQPRRRGVKSARSVLDLVDPGAESPRETWLRLVLVKAGLPRPDTQIPVYDDRGYLIARVDLGWNDIRVAIEYDGDHHRTDQKQFARDILRTEILEAQGWIVVRITAKDRPADVLRRVRSAIARRA